MLSYLSRQRAAECLPGDDVAAGTFDVRTLEMFTITNLMFVNSDTLSALQIIQSEDHPNMYKDGLSARGAKESLSIYGLFHHLARTPQGRHALRRMLLRPSTSLEIIEERLETISVLSHPSNRNVLEHISKYLSKLKDIRGVVIHLQKGINRASLKGKRDHSVWTSIRNFTFNVLQIVDAIHSLENGQRCEVVNKVRLTTMQRFRG